MAISQPNAPRNLTMVDFRSAMDSLGGPAKNCRFAVRVLPEGNGQSGQGHFINRLGYGSLLKDITFLCESVEFPGRGFDFMEARYYGPSMFLPYNTKYSNEITLTMLTRNGAIERQLFDDWMEIINPTNIFDFNYANDYYARIQVYQLSEGAGLNTGNPPTAGEAVYMWELKQAWPMQISPQTVTWADNDVLRLQVTFTYRYWNRPGRDTIPGGPQVTLS